MIERSEQVNELYTALAKAQGQIEPAQKDGVGQVGNQKTRYTTLDSLIGSIRKPLAENGLGFSQQLAQQEGGLYLGTRIFHESGQYEGSYVLVIPMEANRGTNDMQALGSTLTYLKRYMLAAALGLSSGDDDDGAAAVAPPKPNGRKWPKRPWPPEVLREYIQYKVEQDSYTGFASEKQLQFVASSLNEIVNRDEDALHHLTEYLIGKWSLAEISGSEASTLIAWIGASKANDYQPNPDSVAEAQAVYERATIK